MSRRWTEERCPSPIYECKGNVNSPFHLCFFCHILVLATERLFFILLLAFHKINASIISRHLWAKDAYTKRYVFDLCFNTLNCIPCGTLLSGTATTCVASFETLYREAPYIYNKVKTKTWKYQFLQLFHVISWLFDRKRLPLQRIWFSIARDCA